MAVALLVPPSVPANVVEAVVEILPVKEFNDAVSPEADKPPSVDIEKTDNSAVEAPRVDDTLPDSRTEEIDALSIDTVSDADPAPVDGTAAVGKEVC